MSEAPGLVVEKQRLSVIGGTFSGIVGDIHHSFGYHLADPPLGDYSILGRANRPAGYYSCAIDIGMDWAASRRWLRWLVSEVAADRITGIAEVIGSYDGVNVRYWSDRTGWQTDGVAYDGEGHDTWSHVAIYRSTALMDHGILAGWTASGHTEGGDMAIDDATAAALRVAFAAAYNGRDGISGQSWMAQAVETPLRKIVDALAEDATLAARRHAELISAIQSLPVGIPAPALSPAPVQAVCDEAAGVGEALVKLSAVLAELGTKLQG